MDDEARLLMSMSHAELIAECQRLRGRVRELENLPATRTCKCGVVFQVGLEHPRRLVCDRCFLAVIAKICGDCGGDDDAHSDTCPRSPTVVALRDLCDRAAPVIDLADSYYDDLAKLDEQPKADVARIVHLSAAALGNARAALKVPKI